MAVCGGAVLAAGVLAVDPDGWSPFGPAKWGAVLAAGVLTVAVAASGRHLKLAWKPMAVWAAFAVWLVVAAAAGLDPVLAWTGTPQRHFGVLTWLLCAGLFAAGHRVEDQRGAKTAAAVAAASGGLAGLWAIAELAGWEPVRLASGTRLVGPLGSAAYLGAAEALLVPVALGLAADRSLRGWARSAAGLGAALGLVALVGSGARAAWFGFLVAAGAVAWCRRRQLAARGWKVLLAGAACAAAAVVVLGAATGVAGRVAQVFDGNGPGGTSRIAEWRVAARVVAAHPLTGVGPEGYRIAFGSEVGAAYQRRYGRVPLPDRAHDSLLDVAATSGLPGLAAYLGLIGLVGVSVRRSLHPGRAAFETGAGAGLLAYAAGALFLFPLAELDPGAWFLAGMISVRMATRRETVTVRLGGPARLGAEVLLGAALGATVLLGVRAIGADRLVKSALRYSGSGNEHAAVVAASAAVRDDPADIVVRLVAAEVDAGSGTPAGIEQGLGQLAAARRTSPGDPVLWGEQASLLVARARITGSAGDWRAAAAELTSLERADPRNPQVLLQLGLADASLRRWSQADAALEASAALDPNSRAPEQDLALVRAMESG